MSDLDTLAAQLKALGAPGDHGYGTPAGDAIFLAHQILAAAHLTAAARDVLAERQRQIDVKGWTAEHDDEHDDGSLAFAATSYAEFAAEAIAQNDPDPNDVPGSWPWVADWWKPTTPRRDLVKAGALILAEIERLDRAADTEGVADV